MTDRESEVDRMVANSLGPDVDMDKGIKQFGGNEGVYLSILGFYVTDMHRLLEEIRLGDEADLEAYAQTAHGIKGSSRNVFANNIGNAAEELEQAAKNGDFGFVSQRHDAFVEEAWKLVQDIEELIASKG